MDTAETRIRSIIFLELKRRNVYKVAVAYAVVGWLLVQVATHGRNVLCRIQVYLKA